VDPSLISWPTPLAPSAPAATLGEEPVLVRDAEGREVQATRRVLLRPLCANGHDVTAVQAAEFARRLADLPKPVMKITSSPRVRSGPTITFNVIENPADPSDVLPSPAAVDAMQFVADFYAERFTDDVSVSIDIRFGPSFFGATSGAIYDMSYSQIRSRLIADADADDTIQALLPTGSLPVRLTLNGSVTSVSRVAVMSANMKALGYSVGGSDAYMEIDSRVDFTPHNGISGSDPFSGVDILIHEVGHALGFISWADANPSQFVTPLDMFRFPRFGDDTPETEAEFTNFPRAHRSEPNNSNARQHVFHLVDRAHRLSNGSNYQASHFDETSNNAATRVGVMEPVIASGENGYPDFFSAADFDVFDAIGWDRVAEEPCAADFDGNAVVDVSDLLGFLGAFRNGDAEADMDGNAVISVDDLLAFLGAFRTGC